MNNNIKIQNFTDFQNSQDSVYLTDLASDKKRSYYKSPTIYRENGFRYFFFSREETRKHIHIISGNGEAKFWLKPKIELAVNYSFSQKELNKIIKVIEEHYDEFINEWNKHFSS